MRILERLQVRILEEDVIAAGGTKAQRNARKLP